MVPWILISLLVLAVALFVITRQRPELQRRGFALVGVAVLLAIGVEVLIRSDTISVQDGAELMGLAVILLAGWAIWGMPRSGSGG
jgi:hypothetical protein